MSLCKQYEAGIDHQVNECRSCGKNHFFLIKRCRKKGDKSIKLYEKKEKEKNSNRNKEKQKKIRKIIKKNVEKSKKRSRKEKRRKFFFQYHSRSVF